MKCYAFVKLLILFSNWNFLFHEIQRDSTNEMILIFWVFGAHSSLFTVHTSSWHWFIRQTIIMRFQRNFVHLYILLAPNVEEVKMKLISPFWVPFGLSFSINSKSEIEQHLPFPKWTLNKRKFKTKVFNKYLI